MQSRHCTRHDTASKAIANYKVGAVPKRIDEKVYTAKIITVVTIAHNYKTASGSPDSGNQRAAVAWLRHIDNSTSKGASQVLRTVRAPIVGD